MKIRIINKYGPINFDYKKIVKNISDIVTKHFLEKKNATILFVNLDEIHQINLEYRHLDRPTDVITFEEFEDDYLGEIFICIDKIFLQANEYNHSVEREFAFLLVHGLLHLHGYDHLTLEDEKNMFALQDEILDKTEYKRR